jgi:two-component system nitrate/nitrite response regulator NarL
MSNPADVEEAIKIRVLLVDDHEPFLRVATEFLQRHHELVVVGTAREGKEALALAQALRPQIILLDLNMPGLNGLETIPHLRVMLPQTGIIALTLLDPRTYRQAALAAGADDFVSKANLTTDLLPAIRRVAQTVWPRQEHTAHPVPLVDEGDP